MSSLEEFFFYNKLSTVMLTDFLMSSELCSKITRLKKVSKHVSIFANERLITLDEWVRNENTCSLLSTFVNYWWSDDIILYQPNINWSIDVCTMFKNTTLSTNVFLYNLLCIYQIRWYNQFIIMVNMTYREQIFLLQSWKSLVKFAYAAWLEVLCFWDTGYNHR